jgi:hypothetical protein
MGLNSNSGICDLLQAFPRQFQLTVGSLLRLLDKGVQHHDPLTHEKTVKRPSNPGATPRTKLKQPITESARVRQPQVWPEFQQQFYQASIVRKDIHRPRLNLGQNTLMKVFDLERYRGMLARMRTSHKADRQTKRPVTAKTAPQTEIKHQNVVVQNLPPVMPRRRAPIFAITSRRMSAYNRAPGGANMNARVEALIEQAKVMTAEERLAALDALQELVMPPDSAWQEAWAQEIADRLAAYQRGEIEAEDSDLAMERIRQEFLVRT